MNHVYLIRETGKNDVIYVGLTTDPEGRLAAHRTRFCPLSVEMEIVEEHETSAAGRLAEDKFISLHVGPALRNLRAPAPEDLRAEIRRRLETSKESEVIRMAGTSRFALTRILAGVPVLRSTINVARHQLGLVNLRLERAP